MHRLREYFSMNFPNWTSAPRKSLSCPLLVIISPRPTAILMLNTTDLSIFERYVNRSLTIYILLGNKPWRQFSNRRMTQTDVSFTRTIAKNRTPSLWPHLSPLLPPPTPCPWTYLYSSTDEACLTPPPCLHGTAAGLSNELWCQTARTWTQILHVLNINLDKLSFCLICHLAGLQWGLSRYYAIYTCVNLNDGFYLL